MELMFESRSDIRAMSGELSFIQRKPEVHPEPVIVGDCDADGAGVSAHACTVLNEGGKLRMWYQAFPRTAKDILTQNSAYLAYAESDDGIHWRKPNLGLVEIGANKDNNLTNMGLCSPSVWIDQSANPETRYRALGCSAKNYPGHREDIEGKACYTMSSADGYDWRLDDPAGQWKPGRLISGVYHEARERLEVIIKETPFAGNLMRRSFANFHSQDEGWSDPDLIFVPDEYDDIQARERGGVSSDYMNLAVQPKGKGMVGFVGRFRHRLPYIKMSNGQLQGNNGKIDFGLAFQEKAGGLWRQPAGRQNFLTIDDADWLGHCLFPTVSTVEIGDEERLYFANMTFDHGYCYGPDSQVLPERMAEMMEAGAFNIGFASWPKHQLFGCHAEPHGEITIELGKFTGKRKLFLSHELEQSGSIRVEICKGEQTPSAHTGTKVVGVVEGYSDKESKAITKSHTREGVDWNGRDEIQGLGDIPLLAKIRMERATLYGFELV